jgi:hypothetical protein
MPVTFEPIVGYNLVAIGRISDLSKHHEKRPLEIAKVYDLPTM